MLKIDYAFLRKNFCILYTSIYNKSTTIMIIPIAAVIVAITIMHNNKDDILDQTRCQDNTAVHAMINTVKNKNQI